MSRKKILVPIDINLDSADLLSYACSIAKNSFARISLVNVIEPGLETPDERNDFRTRREIELKLAKIATGAFSDKKIEFDIIVTKGNLVSRIVNMSKELNIDLIITHITQLVQLKDIQLKIEIPLVIMKNTPKSLKELVLPVNLDKESDEIFKEGIEVASLVNAQLKIIGFTTFSLDDQRHKKKLDEIKSLAELNNIANTISFIKSAEEINLLSEGYFENNDSESLLVTHIELVELLTDTILSDDLQISSITVLPIKKNKNTTPGLLVEHCFNN